MCCANQLHSKKPTCGINLMSLSSVLKITVSVFERSIEFMPPKQVTDMPKQGALPSMLAYLFSTLMENVKDFIFLNEKK